MTDGREDSILLDLIAQQIHQEQQGERFYIEAARVVRNPRARRLFEELALEESRHREVLEQEQRRLHETARSTSPADANRLVPRTTVQYEGDSMPVFHLEEPRPQVELPDMELFKKSEFRELLKTATLPRILKLAMQIEYDNFGYLVEVAKQMQSRGGREKVLALAEDEKQHFLWLRRQYDRLGQV